MKRHQPIVVNVRSADALRHGLGADKVEAMREGRRTRATSFRPKKGRGSYTRRNKHKE